MFILRLVIDLITRQNVLARVNGTRWPGLIIEIGDLKTYQCTVWSIYLSELIVGKTRMLSLMPLSIMTYSKSISDTNIKSIIWIIYVVFCSSLPKKIPRLLSVPKSTLQVIYDGQIIWVFCWIFTIFLFFPIKVWYFFPRIYLAEKTSPCFYLN